MVALTHCLPILFHTQYFVVVTFTEIKIGINVCMLHKLQRNMFVGIIGMLTLQSTSRTVDGRHYDVHIDTPGYNMKPQQRVCDTQSTTPQTEGV